MANSARRCLDQVAQAGPVHNFRASPLFQNAAGPAFTPFGSPAFQANRQDAALVALPNPHALPPHRLRAALEFIEGHFAEPIGVSDIAGVAGMSAFHFSRAFRLSTGAPPYAYLLRRRIAEAKARLVMPGGSLAIVAGECGFTSPSQFSRMFKIATGVSPSSFRQRH